jgi:hypothetical protein
MVRFQAALGQQFFHVVSRSSLSLQAISRLRRSCNTTKLMRHASIQTTMNVYGKAMTDSKRQAHSKVVEMVLKGKKTQDATTQECQAAAVGS